MSLNFWGRSFVVSILIILIIFFVGSLRYFKNTKEARTFVNCGNNSNQYQCWESLIDDALKANGLDFAFEVLANLYATEPTFASDCHSYTHLLGEAAYKEFAEGGDIVLTPKTSYCGYGFYHSFMETLLQMGGSSTEAREFCSYADKQLTQYSGKTSIACYHGIGHGFVDGGDPRSWGDAKALLKPALDFCKSIGDTEEKVYLCTTGAFNALAIALNSNNYGLKPDRKDPYLLCYGQDGYPAKRACYQEMNTLVLSIAGGDFKKAVAFTKKISEPQSIQWAVEQLAGAAVANNLSRYEDYISVCRESDARDFCLGGLVMGLLEHGKPELEYLEAIKLCDEKIFKKDERDICYDSLISSSSFLYRKEKFKEICQLIPEEYEKLCQNDPNNSSLILNLAGSYFSKGEYDLAEQTYNKAIEIDKNNANSFVGLGNVLRYRGRYEESESVFKKAIALEPENESLYVEMGKLYRNWNKYREAEEMFSRAIKLNPMNDTLYSYGLGYLDRDEGKLEKALEMFKKAFELNPQNDFNSMGMGDIYRDLGQYDKSEEWFKKALAMNPKSEAYMGLGYMYMFQNKDVQAEEAFKNYLNIIKPKSEVYNGLGYIYLRQKRYNEAEEMFKKSIAINPQLSGQEGLEAVYKEKNREE